MKQLLKKTFAMVVLFSTISSYSNTLTLFSNQQTKDTTTVVMDSVNEGSVFMIKDKRGHILHSETIKQAGTFSKKFDLSNIPVGEYYFEVEGQNEIKVTPFTVKQNSTEINGDDEVKISKPMIYVRNDRVYITNSTNHEQTWEIEVYFKKENDLAHREKLRNTKSLNRIYDFRGSEKGNYTLVLTTEGRSFTKELEF